MTTQTEHTDTCKHCGRSIVRGNAGETEWIDPEATGDDSIWRETCDGHDTFEANHEPKEHTTMTTHAETMHEAGKHAAAYALMGTCRICDDLRAADCIRTLYDLGRREYAAAPSLLDALEGLMPDVADPNNANGGWTAIRVTLTAEQYRAARAAIAAARGQA